MQKCQISPVNLEKKGSGFLKLVWKHALYIKQYNNDNNNDNNDNDDNNNNNDDNNNNNDNDNNNNNNNNNNINNNNNNNLRITILNIGIITFW